MRCTSDSSHYEIVHAHLLLFISSLYISLQHFLSLKDIAMEERIIGKVGLIKAYNNACLP